MKKIGALSIAVALLLALVPVAPKAFAAAPVLSATGGLTTFTEGDNIDSTPVVVDSGITVSDTGGTLRGATVSITGNAQLKEDVLAFSNSSEATFGDISATYNSSTGVLTLSSTGNSATVSQWQAALRAVTYTNSSDMPNTAERTISFDAVGSSGEASNTVTKIVTVTATDDAPIVTTAGGTAIYTIDSKTTVVIDGKITVEDKDDLKLSSATVSILRGFYSGDTLVLSSSDDRGNPVDIGNIFGTYYAETGVLTLISSEAAATKAQWANALSNIRFATSSPNAGDRVIGFSVFDGSKVSAEATDSVQAITIPGAPTIGTATAGNGQATVSFTPSANDGDNAITSYTVTSNPDGIVASGSASPITVKGLTNDKAYTFTVTATNGAGTGAPSGPSNSVVPRGPVVPGAPTGVTAAAGNGQATVSFAPPADDGGSAITSYTVTSNPDGIVASGTASPITVTGLTNGRTYTFTVTATNSAGTGSASAASNGVTPIAAAATTPAASRPVIDLGGVPFDPATVDLTKPSVTLDVTPKNGSATVSIPASILSGFAGRNGNFLLEIKAPYGSYRIPVKLASLIPGLADLLAAHRLSAEDISFKVALTDKSNDPAVQSALAAGLPNGRVLGSVVDFSIEVIDALTGQSIGSADQFDEALVRLIPMPQAVSNMPQDWGAFRYNEATGRFEFVPATVTTIDGVPYVAIRSYTNSLYAVADNAMSFPDVPKGHWAEPSVRVAAAKGLVQGVGNGHFAPGASVTRAEFAAMLTRALGRGVAVDSAETGASGYADVQPDSWYYDAVAKARELGLLGFASGSSFRPDQALTREEMAGMLAAAVKLEQPATAAPSASLDGYRDAGGIDPARLEDMQLMVQLGIMTGTSADKLDPQGTTTRGQAAVVLVRTLRTLGLIDQ